MDPLPAGELADPVLAAIVDAVRHALTHVDTVHRDGERLQKRTGCCVPAPGDVARRGVLRFCGVNGVGRTVMHAVVERATPHDIDAVRHLLTENRLPLDGLAEHMKTAFVARQDGRVVGNAALEIYADGALLRSVAVASTLRGAGLGHALTDAAIRYAADRNLPALYLLTTTAERFFPKFGFERIEREDVPASVQASIEFTSACPASATVMRKTLSHIRETR